MLTIKTLSKDYGKKSVLKEVRLSLSGGTLNVLTGSNGTGKSTLLRIIAQLEVPTGGKVELFGHKPRPDQIGYLPQQIRFHSLLTVWAIIEFYGEVWGISEQAAQAALVRWGLEEHSGTRTGELSGGLRQRLGLAVLSIRPAKLILLDEPGLSLDPYWRRQLHEWLERLVDEGVIVLATTHLREEWDDGKARILSCEDGKVRDIMENQGTGYSSGKGSCEQEEPLKRGCL